MTALLVTLCFVAGAGLAAVGAGKLGLSRPLPALAPADALLAEAEDARNRRAWDTPPLGNVRDLVLRARSEFPGDARFTDLSRRASVDVTMRAAEERQAGRAVEALRLARLALEIDEQNNLAAGLVRELAPSTTTTAMPPPVPATSGHRPPHQPPGAHSATPRPSASAGDGPPDGGRWL